AGNMNRVAGNMFPVVGNMNRVAGNMNRVAGNMFPVAGNMNRAAGNMFPVARRGAKRGSYGYAGGFFGFYSLL
ncbi:MAG: hypothetical protein FWG13_04650, partial [Leptospirales bacterium]|nr:hypothetical protein [Leptospirales bacterium]